MCACLFFLCSDKQFLKSCVERVRTKNGSVRNFVRVTLFQLHSFVEYLFDGLVLASTISFQQLFWKEECTFCSETFCCGCNWPLGGDSKFA